jgi:hypothetical protein
MGLGFKVLASPGEKVRKTRGKTKKRVPRRGGKALKTHAKGSFCIFHRFLHVFAIWPARVCAGKGG